MERLQKKIANNSEYSRRKAEELIVAGRIKVNNKTITELGYKVDDSAEIMIDNKVLYLEEKVYYLLHKPKGTISSCNDEKGRSTVVDIIHKENQDNVFPVGRLDYNTTGLLILTNDGELANLLMHPKYKIGKTYVAKIVGNLKKQDILSLSDGIVVDGYKTAQAQVKILKYNPKSEISKVEITIYEGKNHQVKKMFEAIGGKVVELKRIKYGFLEIENLPQGKYRKLSFKEVKKLYSLVNYD